MALECRSARYCALRLLRVRCLYVCRSCVCPLCARCQLPLPPILRPCAPSPVNCFLPPCTLSLLLSYFLRRPLGAYWASWCQLSLLSARDSLWGLGCCPRGNWVPTGLLWVTGWDGISGGLERECLCSRRCCGLRRLEVLVVLAACGACGSGVELRGRASSNE